MIVLKDCIGAQRLQIEKIKKTEHYDLKEACENWKVMRKISIHEALTFISKMGGQGFFFCNCKGKCEKNTCKCKKITENATANATQGAPTAKTIRKLNI